MLRGVGHVPRLKAGLAALGAAFAVSAAAAAAAETPALRYLPPTAVIAAEEARQGVASDGEAIYVADNSTIGKYAASDGTAIARFEGDPARFPHLNSCTLAGGRLVCASSNYPAVPHRGTVEFFDPATLAHTGSRVLPENPGSLTVMDWHGGHWWAVFANYDAKGGMPGKDHRQTLIARLSGDFAVEREYRLPASVLARIAPKSISGAGWSENGCLYLTGHDKPEVYVMQLPGDGDVLVHAGTFATASFGQAIDIDPARPDLLWSIDRRSRRVFASVLPACGEQP